MNVIKYTEWPVIFLHKLYVNGVLIEVILSKDINMSKLN